MRRLLLALLALALPLGLALTVTAPAQATGWSGARCASMSYGARVCTRAHTIPFQNGIKVDQVELCAYRDTWQTVFQGTNSSWFQMTDSNGTSLGWSFHVALNEDAPGGGCSYTSWLSPKAGTQSCYAAGGNGTMGGPYPNEFWNITGANLGGAC